MLIRFLNIVWVAFYYEINEIILFDGTYNYYLVLRYYRQHWSTGQYTYNAKPTIFYIPHQYARLWADLPKSHLDIGILLHFLHVMH